MQQINEIIKEKKFQVKKPRKNEERLILIDRLSTITGWAKRSIHFQTIAWTDSMLRDALRFCEPYSNPKMRNKKFQEYNESTKI